jgi:hypothetical protein
MSNNNNNNNEKINNNYGRLEDLILRFKIPKGKRKNFFELYKQFGHASKKRFASPGLCAFVCKKPSFTPIQNGRRNYSIVF